MKVVAVESYVVNLRPPEAYLGAPIEEMPAFEFQPATMAVANRILTAPLSGGPVSFALPQSPGLGVEVDISTLQEEA